MSRTAPGSCRARSPRDSSGSRQRPRTRNLHLERAVPLAGELLERRRGPRPAATRARRWSTPGRSHQPPARPAAGPPAGRRASPAARPIMSAPGPRAGSSGQVRQVGQLAERRAAWPRGCRCRAASRSRWRSPAHGRCHPCDVSERGSFTNARAFGRQRAVDEIVADPMTGRLRRGRRLARRDAGHGLVQVARAGLSADDLGDGGDRLARARAACAEQARSPQSALDHTSAVPAQRRQRCRSASAAPTVTVRLTGEMSSTYRGLPSAAGRSMRSPRRCPTVKRWVPSCWPSTVSRTVDDAAGRGAEPAARGSRRCPRRG